MRHYALRCSLPATCLILSLLPLVASTHAGQIRYSWSGTIVPNHGDDPWQIGAAGQPFALDVTVSRDALDLSSVNVEAADFAVEDARLRVNSQEIIFAGNGVLDFTDDWSGLYDLLTFNGDFLHLGQTLEFGSLVVLPIESFALTQQVANPAHFPSTANLDRAACCGREYASIVPAGTFVVVVAEPASFALAAACAIFALSLRQILLWRDFAISSLTSVSS